MHQISFCLHNLEDVDTCLLELRTKCPLPPYHVLASVFSSWSDLQLVHTLVDKIQHTIPEALIVGCSTSGEIQHGKITVQTTLLHFLIFSSTELSTCILDLDVLTVTEGAAALLKLAQSKEHLAGIELLIANNDTKTYACLAQLQNLAPNVALFGGVACKTSSGKSYVFNGHNFLPAGIVAIFFAGSDIHIHLNTSLGWHPLGPWFKITKMTTDNIISELDNRPAHLVYTKYLDISQEELARENLLFPLFLERNGQPLLRLPSSATPKGELIMSADCKIGERVRLAYGDPGEIIDSSHSMLEDITAFEPEGIMVFNCVTRRFFLGELAAHEVSPLQDIAPCDGLYTHGEIARRPTGGMPLLNMTIVVVSLREGSGKKFSRPELALVKPKKTLQGAMKLLHHLAHFVSVTSEELELANLRLIEMATTDRLTGLYNRGEIETILKKELANRRQEKLPLSAIMLDLDNFKQINDVFGHDVGDNVLRWVGQMLQMTIRRSDAAGRWGGEEFVILLPGAKLDAALHVAERIQEAFRTGFLLPNNKHVTSSIGVAEFSTTESYMECYRLLDATLYHAKTTGKDRICSPHGLEH